MKDCNFPITLLTYKRLYMYQLHEFLKKDLYLLNKNFNRMIKVIINLVNNY